MKVVAALAILALLTGACATPPDTASSRPVASGGELGERRHEAGAVTVAASWLAETTPTARVALDTHSIDLDGFDLGQLARVRLDGGAWVGPSAWSAPAGGHHRAGTLAFASLDPQRFAAARVIELELLDVAVPSHVLRWDRAP